MTEKYSIQFSLYDGILGLVFEEKKQLVTIGGNKRFKLDMLLIIQEYFGCSQISKEYAIQKNKIRFSFKCPSKLFYKTMTELKVDGKYIIIPVKALDYIMR